MKINHMLLASAIFALFLSGCASRTVTRISPDETIDLSGRWNDADSRLVAEEMIGQVMDAPWIRNFNRNNEKRPVVVVGFVRNRTSEHIEPTTFIKDVEKEFINSQKVRLVQNDEFREKVREERAQQNEFADPATVKRWGKELGADFILFGDITSIVDQYNKRKVISYTVSLELTDIETNEVVWIGDKKIKKYIEN